jgi:vitamin B12 transporter
MEERPYNDFVLVDMRLHYRHKHLLVFAEASNLFNNSFFDLANVPLPGRWIKAGVSYTLNINSKN